jgi:hypothetical protein
MFPAGWNSVEDLVEIYAHGQETLFVQVPGYFTSVASDVQDRLRITHHGSSKELCNEDRLGGWIPEILIAVNAGHTCHSDQTLFYRSRQESNDTAGQRMAK